MSKSTTASMAKSYTGINKQLFSHPWSVDQGVKAFILLALVMVSAIAVVYSVHLSRKTVAALAVLEKQQYTIEVEWGQLLIEQSAWGAYGRVEKIATERLGMKMPEPNHIVMLKKE